MNIREVGRGVLRIVTNGLSYLVGLFASIPIPRILRQPILGVYCRVYGVDREEIPSPLVEYCSFDQFFTRELREESRPIGQGIVSPVDGAVVAAGAVQSADVFEVKGTSYSLREMLGEAASIEPFEGGSFLNVYLSPRDCHRIFAPLDVAVKEITLIPGILWGVNPLCTALVPDVLSRNERVVVHMDSRQGALALVMVGAFNIGSISLTFDEMRSNRDPLWPGKMVVHKRLGQPVALAKGQHLGTFHMGSSIVLFGERAGMFDGLKEGHGVKYGEGLS
jgi:phosphatidylserine decarboxylase